MTVVAPDEFARAARFLAQSEDYRVLRRLRPVHQFHRPRENAALRVGVVLDVETTGLDAETDRIIELAIQRFRYDEAGHIVQVGAPRVWREDPGVPLDPRITALTGLTDEVLKDQAIDEPAALDLLASADLVVAHNARFDRPFVDRRLPAAAGKAWACTMAEVDWLALGFDGRALAHLVSQCGWFYEGHRAQNDILAVLYLMAHDLDDGRTVLSHLLEASAQDSFRVNAIDAPYESKDRLKVRGYRWNAAMRHWSKDIPASEADDERTWLLEQVYAGHGAPAFLPLTAVERYR